MKTVMLAVGAFLLAGFARPAVAQSYWPGRPAYRGWATEVPGYGYSGYGYPVYPAYPYYPYPLPPAPSLGFGRGGIYGHVFVGRDETITGYTFPGRYE